MAITCCAGCVPPKRTPTCKFDGTCDKYTKAKKKHDLMKAAYDQERQLNSAIYIDRGNKVAKAMRKRRAYKR